MLTRRDKLLNRPWQLRRFNNHRLKVLNATPVIDFGPPVERKHVKSKLKKLQWENERRLKIEEENFKLLQRMGSIMKRNRLENHWQTPPPDFLHRVGIYHRTRSPTPYQEFEESFAKSEVNGKRRGCSACTPFPIKPAVIPEERVPWSPPRMGYSQKRSSSASLKPISDFDIPKVKNQKQPKNLLPKIPITTSPVEKEASWKNSRPRQRDFDVTEKRLVLTQGLLKVSINLPSFAEVKIVSCDEEKTLQASHCQCKAFGNLNGGCLDKA